LQVTITRKVLGKSPEEYRFYLSDGRKLQSLYELIDELETMGEDNFNHYVNELDNHFANWVEHVFDEKVLATELRKVKGRIETQRQLLKHMVRELLHDFKARHRAKL